MRTVRGDSSESDEMAASNEEKLGDWNVVQNNGARAAQLVPHIHFHVIPRRPSDSTPDAGKASWVMFGRGKRDELDDDEGRDLAKVMREELTREVKRIREREGVDLDVDAGNGNRGKL
ncbi:hypothetical protein FQN54_005721 [Arachnomyces sp. PD_36]|nr:hypothetical protein FQN54_005721 [Arachnomyces sp. PD_36]